MPGEAEGEIAARGGAGTGGRSMRINKIISA